MIPTMLIKPLLYVVGVVLLIGAAWFIWNSWLSAHDAAIVSAARLDYVQQSELDAANARTIKAQQDAMFNAQQAVQARQQAAAAIQERTDAERRSQARSDADTRAGISRWNQLDIDSMQHR